MKYGEKEEQKKEVALRKERDEFVRKALHYLEFLIHLSLPLPLPLPLLVCLSVCLSYEESSNCQQWRSHRADKNCPRINEKNR